MDIGGHSNYLLPGVSNSAYKPAKGSHSQTAAFGRDTSPVESSFSQLTAGATGYDSRHQTPLRTVSPAAGQSAILDPEICYDLIEDFVVDIVQQGGGEREIGPRVMILGYHLGMDWPELETLPGRSMHDLVMVVLTRSRDRSNLTPERFIGAIRRAFGDYAANDVAAQFNFAPRTSTSTPTASVSAKSSPVHSPSPELATVSHTPNTKDKSAQQLQADDCVQVITGIWLQSFESEEDTSKCAMKWFDFGVALGISPSALSALRSKQPEQQLYDVILKAGKLNLLSSEKFLQAVGTSFGASFIKEAAEQLNITLPEAEAPSSPSPAASVVPEPNPVVSPEPGVATSARVSDAEF